ncbi:Phage integrase family protein [Streptomyces sp. WMMB 322]|nr:Phage integrase family protein [Streptomyces sp. WMMB 322]
MPVRPRLRRVSKGTASRWPAGTSAAELAKPLGGPLSANTDYHDCKRLLDDAGVRDARLHAARHTAATVLMLLGVPDRVIDQIMGWEPGTSARMRARYLHVPDAMLKDVARKLAEAIRGPQDNGLVDKNQDNER